MLRKAISAILLITLAACTAAPASLTPEATPGTGDDDPTEAPTTEPDTSPTEPQAPSESGEFQEIRASVPRIEDPAASPEQVDSLVEGNNEFAIELYRQAALTNDNLIFSPYSISLAFSMLYAGARGGSESQLAEVFNYLPQDVQHAAFNALDQMLTAPAPVPEGGAEGDPLELSIANSVWGQVDYSFLDEYLEILASQYGAGLKGIDFIQDPTGAAEAINDWVEEQTNDRIQDIIPPEGVITTDTRMVLANAIYFKGSWLHPFNEDQTADGEFTLLDGGSVSVPMMKGSARRPYFQGDGFQAVSLPYVGDKAEMLIILPDEGNFSEFENGLDAELIREMRANAGFPEVNLTMPKWDFETSLQLSDMLKAMGVTDLFDPMAADLSGITGNRDLFLSDALHKANITVDERGTEAAASTVLVVGITSMPEIVDLTLDRPFLFAITDVETGAILFIGRVVQP